MNKFGNVKYNPYLSSMKETTLRGLYATENGEIWSKRGKTPIKRKTCFDKRGYEMVDGKLVHRLVAEALIPNPMHYKVVNHINGDKGDNRVENLEWCTQQDNIRHAMRTGLTKMNGTDNHNAKLKPKDIETIQYLYSLGWTKVKIAKEVGVSDVHVGRILFGKNWIKRR